MNFMSEYLTILPTLADARRGQSGLFTPPVEQAVPKTSSRPRVARERMILELVDAGGPVPAEARLKRLLKSIGRAYGFKCLAISSLMSSPSRLVPGDGAAGGGGTHGPSLPPQTYAEGRDGAEKI
jgi:hypothetical protein